MARAREQLRRAGWAAIAVLSCWLASLGARAETRVALVVGNAAYEHAPALANPRNDAAGVAAALRRLGFEVAEAVDLDRSGLLGALHEFSRLLEGAEVGLFFYAGHALQVRGQNYLVPVDAKLEREADLIFQAVELDDTLRLLEQQARTSLVFLDACRDNPLARTLARSMGTRSQGVGRGLAQVASGAGTLIAYATQPDNVALDGQGENSPFTAALLAQIETPGLEVGRLLARVTGAVKDQTQGRQVPWWHASLTGDFYFRLPEPEPEPPPPEVVAPAPTPVLPPVPPMLDVVVWDAIKDSQDPADFETFLALYTDSPLAPFARNRLKVLQAAQTASQPPAEPPAKLPATAEAEIETAATEPEAAAGPTPAALPAAEEAKQPATTALAPTVPTPDPVAVEAALGLSLGQRQEIQVALSALGHDTRGTDGVLGRNSRTALSRWQQARGDETTGYLTEAQRLALLDAAKDALAAWRQRPRPGKEFRDCPDCPLMVVVPAGSFLMGSPPSEQGRENDEGPQHTVTIGQPFAVGKYEVTFVEWDACVAAGGCNGYRPDDRGWGRARRPVINVSRHDAKAYVAWLSERSGEAYRLLSEAEWEYAARAGTTTPFATGVTISPEQANYDNYDGNFTTSVGTLDPNPWGLHDMHGNVWEWVGDCWNSSYSGAPPDGSAWTSGDCSRGVRRGGSLVNGPASLRSANRSGSSYAINRADGVGFRVARTLR